LVDLPLGGLAKWLRFCGFDTVARRLSPADPKSLPPPAPETYILTRQEAFRWAGRSDLLVLTASTPRTQLQEVRRRLKISRRSLDLLSRCSRCNDLLLPVPRDQVLGRVPEHVFNVHEQFYECPRCRRLFWAGSHLQGITRRVGRKGPEAG
jgi:uncharacterized protein with PIN domain